MVVLVVGVVRVVGGLVVALAGGLAVVVVERRRRVLDDEFDVVDVVSPGTVVVAWNRMRRSLSCCSVKGVVGRLKLRASGNVDDAVSSNVSPNPSSQNPTKPPGTVHTSTNCLRPSARPPSSRLHSAPWPAKTLDSWEVRKLPEAATLLRLSNTADGVNRT